VGLTASEQRPQTILLGDRNVTGGSGEYDLTWSKYLGSSIDAAWDNKKIHVQQGNLTLADGSVHNVKTPALRAQISAALADSPTNVIFSLPRGIF
jgi:hypothetical protein